MENQILNEVRSVAVGIKESSSFSMLIRNWKSFSLNLGISDMHIDEIERKQNMGIIRPNEIPYEILKIWKADMGTKATSKILENALAKCGLSDITELLRSGKDVSLNFVWQGKVLTLENLLGGDACTKTYYKIKKSLKESIPSEPIHLLQEKLTPPVKPKYYVSRTLSYRTKLDARIFSHESFKDHIFLVKGISKHELSKIAGYKPVDISGNQLQELTVRFVVLECDDDFDGICKETSKPVHFIERIKQCYFWIRSSKSLQLIHEFLDDKADEAISEDQLVGKIIDMKRRCTFAISGSPGMGKTFVLANLAKKVQEARPNSIVLFIVLQEFAQKINFIQSSSTALTALAEFSSHCHTSKLVLEEMLKSEAYHLYLFLDGYDEILQDKYDLVDAFLDHARKLHNVTVIVTTRPHQRTRLEKIFNQLSYDILPFNDSNQIEFLTRYWINLHGAQEGQRLRTFAIKCLSVLNVKLTNKEKEIAGIPLQCMMLAEVFAEVAVRSSKMETSTEFNMISFFNMYKKLVDLKFSRVSNSLLCNETSITNMTEHFQKYMDAHVHDAIALLFPEWLDKFQPYLKGRDEVDESTLYAVGLIEKRAGVKMPRFIHRTFAEYLLAQFIIENFAKLTSCIHLLFEIIFGREGVFVEKTALPRYKLKHPVIAYFLEMHLKLYLLRQSIEDLLPLDYLKPKIISFEDICSTIKACVCADLENCFDLARMVLREVDDKRRDTFTCWDFKNLPHFAVENSDSVTVSLVKKVLNFTDWEHSGVELKYNVDLDVYNNNNTSNAFHYYSDKRMLYYLTPLHIAVWHGKYNVATYFIQTYKEKVRAMKYLLHACVHASSEDSKAVIEDKLSIIDMLVKLNPNFLRELYRNHTPLLQSKVHIKVLERLVQYGADINEYSIEYGTVLHTSRDDNMNTYNDLVRWALSHGFKLINFPNKYKVTPIMYFEFNDDEVLKLFHEAGADFNAQDIWGDSVLFNAIKKSASLDVMRSLLDYGSDVNHINKKQESAAHFILEYGVDIDHTLEKLKLIKSRGFKSKLLYEANADNETPIHMAETYHDLKVSKFVRKWGKPKVACVLL